MVQIFINTDQTTKQIYKQTNEGVEMIKKRWKWDDKENLEME